MMYTLKNILSEGSLPLLNEEILIPITNNRVVIKEDNNEGRSKLLQKVTIEDIPDNSVAFSFDKKDEGQLSWLINPRHNEANKKCDFILVSPESENITGKNVIIVGELKSKKLNEAKYSIQLINSYMFLKYIVNLINQYYIKDKGKLLIIDENVVFKFIVLTNKPSQKKTSTTSKITYSGGLGNRDYNRISEILIHKVQHSKEVSEIGSEEIVEIGEINYNDLLGFNIPKPRH